MKIVQVQKYSLNHPRTQNVQFGFNNNTINNVKIPDKIYEALKRFVKNVNQEIKNNSYKKPVNENIDLKSMNLYSKKLLLEYKETADINYLKLTTFTPSEKNFIENMIIIKDKLNMKKAIPLNDKFLQKIMQIVAISSKKLQARGYK